MAGKDATERTLIAVSFMAVRYKEWKCKGEGEMRRPLKRKKKRAKGERRQDGLLTK